MRKDLEEDPGWSMFTVQLGRMRVEGTGKRMSGGVGLLGGAGAGTRAQVGQEGNAHLETCSSSCTETLWPDRSAGERGGAWRQVSWLLWEQGGRSTF